MVTVCSVVPNWNGAEFLGACLDSLLAQRLDAGAEHRVVVVDNGSVDDSLALLAEHYPGVDVVALPVNQGFAGGVNRGIERARELGADWVALLNNDAVADPRWLAQLLAEGLARPHVAVLAARSVQLDRPPGRHESRLDTTGDCYTVYGIAYPRGRDQPDDGRYDGPADRDIFAASGGSCLWRMAALDEIGLFAESFFAYWEDVDLSFRARLAGWQVRYVPSAVVRHAVGRTSGGLSDFTRYHTYKNCLLLWLRCMPTGPALRYLPHFVFGLVWQTVSDTLRGRLGNDLRALGEVVRRLPATLAERRRIQRSRTLADADLVALLDHRWPATMVSPAARLRRVLRR